RMVRALGRLALRWFYRDIEVVGLWHVPDHGPALLASNHPNALVDALVVGCTLRRPVTLTAKATLLENPVTRVLLRVAGVVPLRRASDAAPPGGDAVLDPTRNAEAFAAVLDVLEHDGIVLLFPEGKSHSDPALAPLKTGLARIAMMALGNRHLTAVPVIPVGLTFERKWEPRSRVLIRFGTPIIVEDGSPNDSSAVVALTQRVDVGLRDVTLNFRSSEEAHRVLSLATVLAEVLDDFRPLHDPDPPLGDSTRVAQRIAGIVPAVPDLDRVVASRVERFLARFECFERLMGMNAIAASDVRMSTRVAPGVWFAIRELLIAVGAGPFALWGRANHWLPLRITRVLALKMSRAPDEPAMNTIVAGLVVVLAFYVAQISLVGWGLGWAAALAYGMLLPLSATWDFRYADRLRRGVARVRAYLRFRRDPPFHRRLLEDVAWLRSEAVTLDSLIDVRLRGNGR
ncbi:MAG: lysophospholipid acyltransferase family protein, partial [Gemmatimonadaceae bacterium]